MGRLGVTDDIVFEFLAFYFLKVLQLSIDDLYPKRDGIFKRYVAKDVERIKHKKFRNSEKLEFNLNREGLYDSLPESMFHYHSSFKDVSGQTTVGFKEQMERLDEEERYARTFFSVYESEISKLKVSSRYFEESSLSYDFGIIRNYLETVIPFDTSKFTIEERVKLLKVIPQLHTLFYEEGYSGIERILDYLFCLDCDVIGRQVYVWNDVEDPKNMLGDVFLGWDATLGKKCIQNDWVLDVKVKLAYDQNAYYESEQIDNKIRSTLELIVPFYYTLSIKKQLFQSRFELGGIEYFHRLSEMALGKN